MTDFRALCAELHAALEKHDVTWEEENLLDRSAAALRGAQSHPEPEVPTDEELRRRFLTWWNEEGSAMRPLSGHDYEEHARRISEIAWANCAYVARWGNSMSEPTLTVQDCKDMSKHWNNFITEDCTGEIVLDGCFTREDLIEIANTVPTTEA